jgi:uncharacterized protein YbjQ (UPF0145 family)
VIEEPQLTRIEKRGLPDRALRRLEELRGTSSSFFSVPEYAAGIVAGVEPLGQVVGISAGVRAAARGGRRPGRPGRRVRARRRETVAGHARGLAMSRMQDEAHELGTGGVVGARIDEHRHSWRGRAVEFVAVGTAIVRDGPPVALDSPQTVLDLNDRR